MTLSEETRQIGVWGFACITKLKVKMNIIF